MLTELTKGQKGESTGHSCQGIRTSAGLQEKFCDVCGSQFDISDSNTACRHC